MISAEPEIMPERIAFSQSVFATGAVEHWLFRIQEMMIKTLYDITKHSMLNYPQNPLERSDWLFAYPAQPILVINQVKWTEGCVDAINKAYEGNSLAIAEYFELMKDLITAEVNIVR